MQILIKPIITEKSLAKTSSGCYVFKVAKNANKAQIASAIFDLYQVKPVKVNIIRLKAEKKLVRSRFAVAVKSWKKAIVTLKKGQKIPGFEEIISCSSATVLAPTWEKPPRISSLSKSEWFFNGPRQRT